MSPGGRPSEGKVKVNLTLSPEFIKAARKADPNLSRFVEFAGWREIKRLSKRHQGDIRPSKGLGK